MFTKISGRGDPLILIHGFATDHRTYRFLIPRLEKHFLVHAIDLLGFGRSCADDIVCEREIFTEQILRFAERRGIERAVLLGGSAGASYAAMAAIAAPS